MRWRLGGGQPRLVLCLGPFCCHTALIARPFSLSQDNQVPRAHQDPVFGQIVSLRSSFANAQVHFDDVDMSFTQSQYFPPVAMRRSLPNGPLPADHPIRFAVMLPVSESHAPTASPSPSSAKSQPRNEKRTRQRPERRVAMAIVHPPTTLPPRWSTRRCHPTDRISPKILTIRTPI